MSLTFDQALLQLNTPKTVSELFKIVANVSSDLNEFRLLACLVKWKKSNQVN